VPEKRLALLKRKFSILERPFIHLKRNAKNDPTGKSLKAVKVFTYGITLVFAGEEKHYSLENIEDVFLTLKPDTCEKIVAVDAIDKGKQVHFSLYERDFPGLQESMDLALKDGWGGFYKKRNTNKTAIWIHAVCATSAVLGERNPFIYSFKVKNPEFSTAERKRVSSDWGLPDRGSLLRKLAMLVNRDFADLNLPQNHPKMIRSERAHIMRALMVVTTTEVMSLALDGYACDWLSYEESFAWCLKAGNMLRYACSDWDSYAQCMLECFDIFSNTPIIDNPVMGKTASRDSFMDAKTAYKKATEHLSQLPEDPRQIPWLTRLYHDTAESVNTTKILPSDFLYKPELYSGLRFYTSESFRMPARNLAKFILAGGCSVADVSVKLHLTINSLLAIMAIQYVDDELSERVAASFCKTANNLFKFYEIDIDAFEAWKAHVPPKQEEMLGL
jgi:hypothetical protein